jgi:hypothetical protein
VSGAVNPMGWAFERKGKHNKSAGNSFFKVYREFGRKILIKKKNLHPPKEVRADFFKPGPLHMNIFPYFA